MIQVFTPPKHIDVFARCINAEKPNFPVDEWVEENRLYKVKYFADALNLSEGNALTITDNKGNIITPSASHGAFNSERFELIKIVLN